MIKRRSRVRDESTIDITPMLDIVFIMLIFFIVTTSFVKKLALKLLDPMPQLLLEMKGVIS